MLKHGVILIALLSLMSFQSSTIIEWSNNKLAYNNFKKKGPKVKIPQGTIAYRLSWKFTQETGKPPVFKVYNKMDQEQSWLPIQHEEILKELQFQFDYAELYARKIRKEAEVLNKKGEKNQDLYKTKFNQEVAKLQKNQGKLVGVIQNQPDLYKRLNQQLQDSIKQYDRYKN